MARIFRCNVYLSALLSMVFVSSVALAADEERSQVFEAFGLNSGSIVNLEKPERSRAGYVSEVVTIDGQPYILDMQPHSIRARNFVVKAQLADGSYVEREPGVSRLVKGSVRGLSGSRVVGSVLESGLAAKIVMPGEQTYFIEPIEAKLRDKATRAHIVYRRSDIAQHDVQCGSIDPVTRRRETVRNVIDRTEIRATVDVPVQGPNLQFGTALQVAELAIDADFEFFLLNGTEEATVDRIELVVGITNDQYETQTGLTHELTTIIVRSAEPDPYGDMGAFARLDDFVNHWFNEQQSVQRDIAHLFSGTPPFDGIGGVAFLGGVCSLEMGYGMSRIDFNGDLGCSTDLLAHELGHNWNSNHCNCPSNTMNSGLTCSNVFSQASINMIQQFSDTLDCLNNQTDVLLGDVNLDGQVDLLDVGPFVDLLTSGEFQREADINEDGSVDLLDVGLFVALLTGS